MFAAPYYTCISGPTEGQLLLSVDVTSNAVQILNKPLTDFVNDNQIANELRALDGNNLLPGFIIGNDKVVFIKDNHFELSKVHLSDKTASATVVDSANGPILVQTWTDEVKVINKNSVI